MTMPMTHIHLPDTLKLTEIAVVPGEVLAQVEAQTILAVMAMVQGNKTRAAGILGISVRALRYKYQQIQADPASMRRSGSGADPVIRPVARAAPAR